jgi:hypothetical protein
MVSIILNLKSGRASTWALHVYESDLISCWVVSDMPDLALLNFGKYQ